LQAASRGVAGGRLQLCSPPLRLEQVLVAGPVVGDGMLEGAEGGGPEFHAIQILPQPLESFDAAKNAVPATVIAAQAITSNCR